MFSNLYVLSLAQHRVLSRKGEDAASDCGPGCLSQRGVPVPGDHGEAAQDGAPDILQQDVPCLLPHRLCHWQHGNIHTLQVVDGQVSRLLE